MSTPELLLTVNRALVVAPAGCGKTKLLVDTMLANTTGRVLVLTHTRAGVAVIRSRLAGVGRSLCRVATLDNWSSWFASRLPGISGYIPTHTARDYRLARLAAIRLLGNSSIRTLLSATYDRVLVDEYQDCDTLQHAIVLGIAQAVPTIVLGDPMQRIFDFGPDGLPPWSDVTAAFGTVWTLETPWRWHRAGETRFGHWVQQQRARLEAGGTIDFRASPENVRWLEVPDDDTLHQKFQLDAIPRPVTGTTMLVMNDRTKTAARRNIARQGVQLSVVEPADLAELLAWAKTFDSATGYRRVTQLLLFAHEVMTGIDLEGVTTRLTSILRDTAYNPVSDEEAMLIAHASSHGEQGVAHALQQLATSRTVFRPDLLESMCRTARMASKDAGRTLAMEAERARDRRAAEGRRVETRAIGSTLLLKGLEADHAVVLDTDVMKATDLYVAISRASRSLTIVSKSPVLPLT